MKHSQITNYYREDWVEHFKQLCYGSLKSRSAGRGRIQFSGCHSLYGDKYDSFATMARILPLLGYWLRNPNNPRVFQYRDLTIDVVSMFQDAFLAGTGEGELDYWGKMYDRISKIVEVNDLVWSLWLAKDTVLEVFTKDQLDQIFGWMDQIYNKVIWDNNWRLTSILVHLVKLSFGYIDCYDISDDVESIEKMYRGDGWYSDSTGVATFDYYNAWQLHFGTLIMVEVGNDILGEELCNRYKDRTQTFLKSFPYFFGSNGAHIPFGRSLSYKYAVLGTMLLARYMGISPLEPGLERRIASGNLKYFIENGSVNEQDFLECGFLKEPKVKYEVYMFYGSPYWCCRGLLCLMFDEESEFFSADELELPVEKSDFIYQIPSCGFTLIGEKKTGHVQMLCSKNFSQLLKRSEPFYSKFMYSSHMYFNYVFQNGKFPRDSMIYCYDSDGDYMRVKEISNSKNEDNYIYRVMIQGKDRCKDTVTIKSYVIYSGIYQIRLHELENIVDGVRVEEGTYPIEQVDSCNIEVSSNWIYASNEKATIYIENAYGYEKAMIQYNDDLNLVYQKDLYLMLQTDNVVKGRYHCASICVGQPDKLYLEEIQSQRPKIEFLEKEKAFRISQNEKSTVFRFE